MSASPTDLSAALDQLFVPWNRCDAPGLVVGLARRGRVEYRRAFGLASLEAGVANTPTTRMRICSITKHFTALLALLLAEEGRIDLDAPLRHYLPELKGPAGDPSARLLLQHRGGSRCYIDTGAIHRQTGAPPGTALATQVRQSGRNFPPGAAMIYNNSGYHLVSVALERLTGTTFATLLEERLLRPLRMYDTGLAPSDYVITPGIASMHVPMPPAGWRRGLFPSEELLGEGGLVSTVDDMLRWVAHLRRPSLFGSRATWLQLTQRPVFPDGFIGDYALGVTVEMYRGVDILAHAGGVFGGWSYMLTAPSHDLDLIMMANRGADEDPVYLARRVIDIALANALGPPLEVARACEYSSSLGDWYSPESGLLFTLGDDRASVGVSYFKSPFLDKLVVTPDGRVTSENPYLGILELCRGPDTDHDALTVREGGRILRCRRAPASAATATLLEHGWVGEYESDDADCGAVIYHGGADCRIEFRGRFGNASSRLVIVDATLAHVAPDPQNVGQPHASLSRMGSDGSDGEFSLNTLRSRHLRFRRKSR
jgi:D-aminopeptidase